MAGVVRAVSRDVALTESVSPKEVIHPTGDGVCIVGTTCHQLRHCEYHEVIEDPAVGAPVPTLRGRVRLTPGLPALQLQ